MIMLKLILLMFMLWENHAVLVYPHNETLGGCIKTIYPLYQLLRCEGVSPLLSLENMTFSTETFIDINSDLKSFKNMTCAHLHLQGELTHIKSIQALFGLDFKVLSLKSVNDQLIKTIFQTESNTLRYFVFNSMTFKRFDLKFDNFPILKSIILGGIDSKIKIESLGSNLFLKLRLIEEIDLGHIELRYLEENSLVFSNTKRLRLKISNNLITTD